MEKIIHNLEKRYMKGYLAANADEARNLAMSLIPPGSKVGMGHSLTLKQIGVVDALVGGGYDFVNQFEPGISREEIEKRRKLGTLVDVYFTGTNAVTVEGELYNIDGKGNRVANMMYGPGRVVVVVGRNKIVIDEQEAWERIKGVAVRLTAQRGIPTPCAKAGRCVDCRSPQRICNFYTVIRSQMEKDAGRIHVIIVDEHLGE